jgi:hypothetical protein
MRSGLFHLTFLAMPCLSMAQELPPTALSESPVPAKREAVAEPLLGAFDFKPIRTKELDLDHETWRFAVDFGLPNGIRVQRRIFDSNFWLEGGVGAWWVVPYASACIRYDWKYLQLTRNCFSLRPGLSATFIAFGPTIGVGWDMEAVWTHRYRNNLRTDLGIRFGMTALVNNHWNDKYVPLAPILSLVLNLAF